jgi:hypothetical protein
LFTSAWPLLGRHAERKVIDEPMAAAREGPSGAVMLYPSAPIGMALLTREQQLRDELPEFLNASFEAAPAPVAAASQLRRDLHVCRRVQ